MLTPIIIATLFFTNTPKNPQDAEVQEYTKSLALIRMIESNAHYRKNIVETLHQSTTTLDELNIPYVHQKLKQLRKKYPSTLDSPIIKGWRLGTEKALFLLDYEKIDQILQAYEKALKTIIKFSHKKDGGTGRNRTDV